VGIKSDPQSPGTFIVSYSKRHPISRMPICLRRKGIKTKGEAQRVLNQLVIEVEDRIRQGTMPKWSASVDAYIQACRERGLTNLTIHGHETCLRAHTIEAWGSRYVDSITTQEIRSLLNERLGQRTSSHQKYFLKVVRSVFAMAVESGVLQRNPTPVIRFKIGAKIKAVLTEPQAKEFLARARALNSDWYPIWAMALYTGMRSGELYALTWDKVNLDARTIKVDSAWNNKDGFKSTKSGNDRIIEIAPALLPVLKDLKLTSYDTPFVLPRSERWDRGQQAHDLRMFLAGMGLQPIRFHDLRATWATILLSKGVEPIKVMKMGGWQEMETMMIYARKAGVDIKGSTDCLDLHQHEYSGARVLKMSPGSDS